MLHEHEEFRKWTDWKRCFMVWRRESISGKMIWGFGWYRECDGLHEDPDKPGYYFVPGKQFAKTRREIFLQNLKEIE